MSTRRPSPAQLNSFRRLMRHHSRKILVSDEQQLAARRSERGYRDVVSWVMRMLFPPGERITLRFRGGPIETWAVIDAEPDRITVRTTRVEDYGRGGLPRRIRKRPHALLMDHVASLPTE